jgi:hypothetical protein
VKKIHVMNFCVMVPYSRPVVYLIFFEVTEEYMRCKLSLWGQHVP